MCDYGKTTTTAKKINRYHLDYYKDFDTSAFSRTWLLFALFCSMVVMPGFLSFTSISDSNIITFQEGKTA